MEFKGGDLKADLINEGMGINNDRAQEILDTVVDHIIENAAKEFPTVTSSLKYIIENTNTVEEAVYTTLVFTSTFHKLAMINGGGNGGGEMEALSLLIRAMGKKESN